MQRLLASVRNGRIDVVVVHRLDRLSRRVADCTALLEEFGELGVELRIAAMPELAGGALDTLLLNVLSSFAEFEQELIASRISDRRAGLISRGRRIAGRTPYGYSADPRTKQLIPKPEEAVIVRELFDLISSGVPPSEVERIVSDRGWQTRNGRPLTARQVLETVSNPVYTGHFRTASGTRPGVHEPIVSPGIFQRCADAVAVRRTGTSRSRQRRIWSALPGESALRALRRVDGHTHKQPRFRALRLLLLPTSHSGWKAMCGNPGSGFRYRSPGRGDFSQPS